MVEAIAERLPGDLVRVAESGISDRRDVERLQRAGYDGFLVGEYLVRAEDPERALRGLLTPDVESSRCENREC
jgi:indole-3-glycerol phosphate synthase